MTTSRPLVACIEWLFAPEHPDIADRIRACKAAGIGAVDIHLWRDKPLAAIRAALDETGVALQSMVVEPRCRLADPAVLAAFREAFRETVAAARQLGARNIIPSVGLALPGLPVEQQRATVVAAIREAVTMAGDAGIGVLLEPVNSVVDHPGMFLDNTREGLAIVAAVNAPNLRLLYDIYHSATMGEDPDTLFGEQAARVGYVQVADSPGRSNLGSGGIDWPRYMRLLDAIGYRGAIGLEYKVQGTTLESLQQARARLR
jgi:hydroxypyruvate isomerase